MSVFSISKGELMEMAKEERRDKEKYLFSPQEFG